MRESHPEVAALLMDIHERTLAHERAIRDLVKKAIADLDRLPPGGASERVVPLRRAA